MNGSVYDLLVSLQDYFRGPVIDTLEDICARSRSSAATLSEATRDELEKDAARMHRDLAAVKASYNEALAYLEGLTECAHAYEHGTLTPPITHERAHRMDTNLKPIHDRVIIRRIDPEEKTKSGLFIPDTARMKPNRGIVVAVGPGKLLENGERVPPDVRDGDEVVFGPYDGVEVKDGVDKYIALEETKILAVVSADDPEPSP